MAQIRITNSGNGPAYNVELNIWQGNTLNAGNYLSSIDTTRIELHTSSGIVLLPVDSVRFNTTVSGNYGCLGSTPVRRVIVTIPQINAGDTDTLFIYQNSCCKSWCGSPSAMLRLSYELNYQDECRSTAYINSPRQITGGTNPRAQNITHSGSNGFLCLTHNYWSMAAFNSAQAYIQVTLIIPPGIQFSGNLSDVFFQDFDSTIWNGANIVQSGDTLGNSISPAATFWLFPE